MPTLNWLKNATIPSLVILLAVLLVAFGGVMFFEYTHALVGGLLDLSEKNEILKCLGFGMGGVVLAMQLVISHRRARAMENTKRLAA